MGCSNPYSKRLENEGRRANGVFFVPDLNVK